MTVMDFVSILIAAGVGSAVTAWLIGRRERRESGQPAEARPVQPYNAMHYDERGRLVGPRASTPGSRPVPPRGRGPSSPSRPRRAASSGYYGGVPYVGGGGDGGASSPGCSGGDGGGGGGAC